MHSGGEAGAFRFHMQWAREVNAVSQVAAIVKTFDDHDGGELLISGFGRALASDASIVQPLRFNIERD